MPTLRDIAAQRGWNIDWNRLNQSGNDDGNAYRRQIFDMVNQQYNPYGTMGAAGLDPMGRAGEVDVSIIPDDLSGQWGEMARRLGARDAPELRGMLSRGRGETLFSGDRGMYNEYVADLGNMTYDDALGWVPGEGGWQQGNRVGQSFRNMGMWGPAAVLGVGMLGNMGLFGAAEGAGGFASAPPGLEGAPSLTGGGTVATGGSAGATPGFAGSLGGTSGSLAGSGGAGLFGGAGAGGGAGGGFYSPDTLGSMTQNAPGSFDMGGWSGSGINGNTGSSGFWGNLMSDPMGTLGNAASRAGSWAMNNPMQALQLASGLFGSQQGQGGGGGEQGWNPMQGGYDPGPAPRQPIYQPIVNGQQLNQDEYLRRIGYGRG